MSKPRVPSDGQGGLERASGASAEGELVWGMRLSMTCKHFNVSSFLTVLKRLHNFEINQISRKSLGSTSSIKYENMVSTIVYIPRT